MNTIDFKGVSSTTIDGLLICELPPISKPPMRIAEKTVDGRHGTVIEELGYTAYDKSVLIGLRGNYDINKVIKFFSGEGDIVFSNEPDKVYRGQIINQIDYNRLLRFRQATVVFRVQPFKHKHREAFAEVKTTSASGTSLVLTDCASARFKSFRIFGKSTQNGTPTPSAPIDIVSVGDDGNVSGGIYGVVLTDWSKTTSEGNPIFSCKGNKIQYGNTTGIYSYKGSVPITLPSGIYTAYVRNMTDKTNKALIGIRGMATTQYLSNANQRIVLNITQPTTITLIATTSNLTEKLDYSCYVGIVKGDIPITNCPMIDGDLPLPQTFNFASSLKAIPTMDASRATYTDANGKMWIADEIDLRRGVRIQRVKVSNYANGIGFDSTGLLFHIDDVGVKKKPYEHKELVCNRYEAKTLTDARNSDYAVCQYDGSLYIRNKDFTTEDSMWMEMGMNPVSIIAELDKPIETPLTEAEISACKRLLANEPSTTILNDENASMAVECFKPYEVFNEGLEPSKPLIVINGSGTIELKVNGMAVFTYTFPDGEDEVYIDCDDENAYLDSVLKNRNMLGEFPELVPKTNKVEWSGDIANIKILARSRWL